MMIVYSIQIITVFGSKLIVICLINKDRHFKKDPQYIFYILWQEDLRKLSADVYNVLKSTRRAPMSVSTLLNRVASVPQLY